MSHKALSSAALLRGRPDGVVVPSALESRGRGFKSRSGQFLGFSLCDGLFISLTGLSSFVLIIYSCFEKGCPTEKQKSVRDNTERHDGLWLFTVASSSSRVFSAMEGGVMNININK